MLRFGQDKILCIAIVVALLVNIICWFLLRDTHAQWGNVPPAPDIKYTSLFGLGDSSLAYRMNGIMLQNLGDTGGKTTSLNEYDYNKLSQWFFIQDSLDHVSNYTPYLAAYYFGGVQDPKKFRPVLGYLEKTGKYNLEGKWRFLAHAIFMARFNIKDNEIALSLAHSLAALDGPDMPSWTNQMPAFIMTDKGDKNAAYALMLEILKSSADKMHPNEINAMKHYICTRILDIEQSRVNPLCIDLP